MTPKEYEEKVAYTINHGLTGQHKLINYAFGIAGESGEIVDLLKKKLYHNFRTVQDGRILEEIGDLLWYITALTKQLDSDLETVMNNNIIKLNGRYPQGFPGAN